MKVEHIGVDELDAWLRIAGIALIFGGEDREHLHPWALACVRYAVRDRGQLVASAAHFPTELTLPGGATVFAGAVTMVGVLPTHRRRGATTAMMHAELTELREQGAAAAVLLASEAMIYGRFGYGPTTRVVEWSVDRLRGQSTTPPNGPFRLIEKDEAAKLLPDLFERLGRRRHGSISRPPGLWESRLADPPGQRDGASELFIVVHEAPDGSADGFASYRLKDEWEDSWLFKGTATVRDVVGRSAEVEADLWRYLLSLDLISRVQAPMLPLDHVLPWLLDNPRAATATAVHDGVWLRPLDPAGLLTDRSYLADGRVTFTLDDPVFEDLSGGYVVEVVDGQATVERRDVDDPDARLTSSTLGSLLLGGYAPAPLVQAGVLSVRDEDALRRLTRLFATELDPWCTTDF